MRALNVVREAVSRIGSSSAPVSPIHVGSDPREESARGDDEGDGGIEEERGGGRPEDVGGGRPEEIGAGRLGEGGGTDIGRRTDGGGEERGRLTGGGGTEIARLLGGGMDIERLLGGGGGATLGWGAAETSHVGLEPGDAGTLAEAIGERDEVACRSEASAAPACGARAAAAAVIVGKRCSGDLARPRRIAASTSGWMLGSSRRGAWTSSVRTATR